MLLATFSNTLHVLPPERLEGGRVELQRDDDASAGMSCGHSVQDKPCANNRHRRRQNPGETLGNLSQAVHQTTNRGIGSKAANRPSKWNRRPYVILSLSFRFVPYICKKCTQPLFQPWLHSPTPDFSRNSPPQYSSSKSALSTSSVFLANYERGLVRFSPSCKLCFVGKGKVVEGDAANLRGGRLAANVGQVHSCSLYPIYTARNEFLGHLQFRFMHQINDTL